MLNSILIMFDEDYKDSWAIKMIKRPFQNPKEMVAIKNKIRMFIKSPPELENM